jgi:ABC-type multidrug transport system fused ATPase/permease subunit
VGTLPETVAPTLTSVGRKQKGRPEAGLFRANASVLADLEVKNIHNQKRSAIEQNNVAADHNVLAIRRRRRKVPLEIVGATHNFFPQSGRQRAPHYELTLKTGRQPITLGQARRQVFVVLAIPASHLVAVVVGIRLTVAIFIVAFTVSVAVIVVIVAILFVVAVTMPLGNRQGGRESHAKDRVGSDSKPDLE